MSAWNRVRESVCVWVESLNSKIFFRTMCTWCLLTQMLKIYQGWIVKPLLLTKNLHLWKLQIHLVGGCDFVILYCIDHVRECYLVRVTLHMSFKSCNKVISKTDLMCSKYLNIYNLMFTCMLLIFFIIYLDVYLNIA